VRLASPAPASTPATGGGRVIDPGRDGRGARDGVRVAVNGPSWLVLGESYDAGWTARCDGRSLGKPVALQGYANAWPVQRGCRDVSFAFAPNRALLAGDLISLVACLALLALLVLRRPRPGAASLAPLPDAPARAWPPRRALVAAVAAGLVLGFVFALRAGAVLAPLTFLVLWRGLSARTLALVAGGILLVLVPVLHLAVGLPGEGYDTNYAVQRIAEHWLAVGAVCALAGALWLTLSPALARRRDPDS
jgi:arabinofuranan 3-O-arabinosyltransferase